MTTRIIIRDTSKSKSTKNFLPSLILIQGQSFRNGTVDAYMFEVAQSFRCLTLLDEIMYTYVTCYPDTGYAISIMSKFFTKPPQEVPFELLKRIT